jgi:dipeptidyl aminopeptidase/acylaminoacyl peptidase
VLQPLETPFTEFSFVRADSNRAVFRAGAPNHPASMVVFDLTSGTHHVLKKETDLLDQSELQIANYLSTVKSVEFSTTDGNSAYGLFYPPHNPDYAGPATERPPLLAKCHGGHRQSYSHNA